MKLAATSLAALLTAILSLAASGQSQPSVQEKSDFFETQIRPVLMDVCFKCHGATKADHDLRVDSREALLKGGIGGSAVTVGAPERSSLINVIRSNHGEIKLKKRLSDAVEADFLRWIGDGAFWSTNHAAKPDRSATARHWAFIPVQAMAPPEARSAMSIESRKTLTPALSLSEREKLRSSSVESPPDDQLAAREILLPRPVGRGEGRGEGSSPQHGAGSGWSDHPVDRFIHAKMDEQQLAPVREADRRTLIRRVYFDLIGLPPTPDDVDRFVHDDSPGAWKNLIEKLLASPRYGERWGRHWLDVARYADTAGDNADYPVPEARLYRDYVIDAFNADKPYNEFVHEQLAGDVLARQGPPEKYAERVIATTFLGLSRRYATAPFELMHLTIEDSIETTGRAFAGLTFRCARCHDHKYDPITKEDYYGLYGLFESTRYPYGGSEEFLTKNFDRSGFIPLQPLADVEAQIEAWRQQIKKLEADVKQREETGDTATRLAALKTEIETQSKALKAAEEQGPAPEATSKQLAALNQEREKTEAALKKELAPLREELKKLKRFGLPADVRCAYGVTDAKPVDSPLQVRGEPAEKGPIVKRAVPKFFCDLGTLDIPEGASGRLEFAQWLTNPRHPLTARVMVNRIWQHHFGKGIVATPSNFGIRGEPPTHPELLDFLAAKFVEGAWSIKAMHRLILTSKTYQLASDWNQSNAQKDESNRCYWRFDRRRLDAEAIRDSMMFVAGTLDLRRPGPHPFPSIEKWNWTQHSPFKAVYESNHRSVYLMIQRIQRHPYLSLFDAPDANTSTDVRTSATVPLQALYLMNNPFVQQQASAFARELVARKDSDEQRVRRAVQLAYSRQTTSAELQKALEYLKQHRDESSASGIHEGKLDEEAWTSYARVLLTSNEFVYVD